ncbi:MAG: hypothetical protein Q8Q12_04835, partial [bacterium]|nr:hypothetical protein [bacterium]
YTAWAAGEGYSSDNLALGRVAERTVPEPLVVIVRPSLRIVGTAVYTGEKTGPASEVQVDLLPSSRARGMDVASAETDKEGRFIFDQVPGGRPYLLRCETEEWAALEEIDLPESAEAGAFEVTLSLKKLVAIDGRVVEEGEEQNPIEGATVHIEPYWGVKAVPLFLQRLRGKSALTGAQGEFSLPVLPDVTYQIKAEAPQYIWRERASEENPDRTGEGWLEVKPPATVTLDLYHGTTIGGLVYLPGGQPAAGAEVTLTRVRGSLYTKNWTQMADLGGRFSFPCTEVSLRSLEDRVKYVHLAASSGPYSAVDMVKVPAEERNVELILSLRESPLVVLQGIVTDTEEHPVANASLYGGSKSGKPICHSDENGFFEVRFPSVRYVGETPLPRELQVWKEGYEVVDVETSQLETAARDNNPLRVILPRSDGRIAGTIVFHDGAPLCNEVVDLLPTSGLMPGLGIGSKDAVVLGQRGEFALEGIRFQGRGSKLFEAPVKSIDLQVTWYPDRESRTLKVKASRKDIALGASDVVVRFDPTLELRGRMVDEEHGGPITDVSLELRSLYFVRSGRSDAAGEFRLRWMSPGEWHLKARCPGYFPWEKQIEVRLGAEDLGDIVLYRRLIVLGHAVSQSTGMPIEGAEVRVVATERMFGDSPSVSAVDCAWDTTDSAGRFSLRFNNPFNDIISDFLKASYAMSVIIKQGRARASREIDPSHVGPSGVIALGRIEL